MVSNPTLSPEFLVKFPTMANQFVKMKTLKSDNSHRVHDVIYVLLKSVSDSSKFPVCMLTNEAMPLIIYGLIFLRHVPKI